MALTYIQIIGVGFPAVKCHGLGDGAVYSNIVWDEGDPLPTQATLDAWAVTNEVAAAESIIDSTVLSFYTGVTNAMSGTSIVPVDNSAPLITEGTQVWARTITPKHVDSKFVFAQTFMLDSNASNRNITLSLFRGSVCIYATAANVASVGRPISIAINSVDQPNTTAAVTYSVRVGISSSATWYINQTSSSNAFGGTANKSDWTIKEIK